MRRGFSLMELSVSLTVIAAVAAFALPRIAGVLDALATDAAARDITTALAVTRNAAIMQGRLVRLRIDLDTLRIDRLSDAGWEPFLRWPGPAERGASLQVSNPEIVFGPTGVGWGASNTTVTIARGSHAAKITTSRVGRVKRW